MVYSGAYTIPNIAAESGRHTGIGIITGIRLLSIPQNMACITHMQACTSKGPKLELNRNDAARSNFVLIQA